MNVITPHLPRALIAEDEPVLAEALQTELAALWPELTIAEIAHDGASALAGLLARQPDIAFLDIRMPGMSGVEVAEAMLEDWPDGGRPPPAIVFVTAYDAHAVDAFELHATDYLLKPVSRDRLERTVARLRRHLNTAPDHDASLEDLGRRLGPLLAQLQPSRHPPPQPPLRQITAAVGNSVRLITVDDVVYLQATDKYVNVVTATSEALVRVSLNSLMARLDTRFAQIHRGTVVNLDQVASAERDENGRLSLVLRQRRERLAVSRLYTHLFKPM